MNKLTSYEQLTADIKAATNDHTEEGREKRKQAFDAFNSRTYVAHHDYMEKLYEEYDSSLAVIGFILFAFLAFLVIFVIGVLTL